MRQHCDALVTDRHETHRYRPGIRNSEYPFISMKFTVHFLDVRYHGIRQLANEEEI